MSIVDILIRRSSYLHGNLLLRDALQSLMVNKLRTFLAVFGMVVGVASVITMVSVGKKGESVVLSEIRQLGTDTLVINAGDRTFMGRRRRRGSKVTTLTLSDAYAIKEKILQVREIAPQRKKGVNIRFENSIVLSTITGVTPSFFHVMGFSLTEGKFFQESDTKGLKRVLLVGSRVGENLSQKHSLLGKIVKIRNIPFRVIGVLESKGVDAFGDDQDNQVFTPITTLLRRFLNQTYISTILVKIGDEKELKETRQKIIRILRHRHRLNKTRKKNDFTVSTISELLSKKNKASRMFSIMTTSVASISMIVAGIGIMAVMLISVNERTMEIGLRRAVGATKNDLLIQFLFEALLLGVSGGGIGAFLGILISWIIILTNSYRFELPFLSALLASLFAMMVSLFFGVFPARKAANLSPSAALSRQ